MWIAAIDSPCRGVRGKPGRTLAFHKNPGGGGEARRLDIYSLYCAALTAIELGLKLNDKISAVHIHRPFASLRTLWILKKQRAGTKKKASFNCRARARAPMG